MHDIISAQEDWQTALARRVILGLWHPRFILATIKIVPYLRRSYIGASISLARGYFWDYCHIFIVNMLEWPIWLVVSPVLCFEIYPFRFHSLCYSG
jgi:hypothetical protein